MEVDLQGLHAPCAAPSSHPWCPEHLEHGPLQRGRGGVHAVRRWLLPEAAGLRRCDLLPCCADDLHKVHSAPREAGCRGQGGDLAGPAQPRHALHGLGLRCPAGADDEVVGRDLGPCAPGALRDDGDRHGPQQQGGRGAVPRLRGLAPAKGQGEGRRERSHSHQGPACLQGVLQEGGGHKERIHRGRVVQDGRQLPSGWQRG
mmetsp:Transcript_93529/g.264525  ORF Transcript_93529/g.264525 Transcript_93529/m.264525 type:complete len:202 (+) Transcript_93529:1200-1805(+)